jgi:FtsZ-binding cell division protein ZapB
LDKLLGETEAELTQYKGKNEELDNFLKEKNEQLQEYAERIQGLLKQQKVNKNELDKALEEIDQLRFYRRKYIAQIDSLSLQIESLNIENNNLKGDVRSQKRKNEDLTMENVGLNKVAIGAKLNTANIFVTGVKFRSNGKEKETIKVSQIEQLKITFNIAENYVAEKRSKDIILKVIGPDGTTVYNNNAGSGTFKFQNEESIYSSKKTIEFTQDAQTVNFYWNKGSDWQKGKYKAELFADGFKIGSSDFELK